MRIKNWVYLTLVGFSLTPLLWFVGRAGVLINGVDTNFPLNPLVWLLRRFYAWNDVPNAGTITSSNISGIFFHLIQTVPFVLGANLQTAQIVSLIFWFTLVVLSSYFFVRQIVSNRFAQLLFVSIYTYNIYLFNTWENIKVSNLGLVVGIPLFLAILLVWEKNKSLKKLILLSTISSIVISGAGINPAYFLIIVSSIILWSAVRLIFLKGGRQIRTYLLGVLTVLAIIFLVNIFWILPTIQYIFFSHQSITNISNIGFNNWVDSLSQNTSFLNVFRLQGAWDWYSVDSKTGTPLYIPYANNYFLKKPFLLFSFLLPSLVMVSLIYSRGKRRYLYSVFGIFLLIGLFLGMGTHPPTSDLFIFLANHVPFFSFFRSPWYIFTPILITAIAGLIGLFVENIFEEISSFGKRSYNILAAFIVLVVIANLVYSYPLVTGKIFRPNFAGGFYIRFPSYVFDAKNWLEKQYISDKSRIIGYPSGEIEEFKWGYRGTESILELFSPYEVLFSPLNATDSPVATMVADIYRSIDRGAIDSAANLANRLNIGLIFDKEDQSSLSSKLPNQFVSSPVISFGSWYFYHFPNARSSKIFTASDFIETDMSNKDEYLINDVLSLGDTLINRQDSVVQKIINAPGFIGDAILAQNSQMRDLDAYKTSPYDFSAGLSQKDLTKIVYQFTAFNSGRYQPILERYRLEDFGFDVSKKLDVLLDGNTITLDSQRITDSYVYFNPINVSSGYHTLTISLLNPNLIEGGGDMTHFATIGEGNFRIIQTDNGKYLTIYNSSQKDISAIYNVLNFDTRLPYLISVDYKQTYGNYAQILMFQSNASTPFKSQEQSLPNYPDWKTFSFYYTPVNSVSNLQVFLNAPFTKDPLGTTVNYSNLSIRKVFTNNLILLKSADKQFATPAASFKQESPVSYLGEVSNGGHAPHVLVFSENYSPDWELILADQNNNKLNIQPSHFSANSYANAWYIENAPEKYKFKIYYKPQSMLNLGFAISLSTIVGALLICLIPKRK